jgi:hypothetical protein
MKAPVKGALIATAIAGMFVAGTAMGGDHKKAEGGEKVKCHGVNECKGKSGCHTADNSCAGQNSCKGKGWVKMTKKECEEKGGTVDGKKKKK